MELIKVLERKAVIRLFGFGLLLSPFFNTFLTMLTFNHVRDQWSMRVFWFVTSNRPVADQILYVTTFVIGVLMLRGAAWAWKVLLVLLGAYIVNQTMHFGPNFRANKLSAVFFLANVGLFIFIADQLAWKVKKTVADIAKPTEAKPVTSKKETVAPRKTYKQVPIHFDALGPWGRLSEISPAGLRVQTFREAPRGIETNQIEVALTREIRLRVIYSHHEKNEYYFKFIKMTDVEVSNLNSYLLKIAA